MPNLTLAYKQGVLKTKLRERVTEYVISSCPFFCLISDEVMVDCFRSRNYLSNGSILSGVYSLLSGGDPSVEAEFL